VRLEAVRRPDPLHRAQGRRTAAIARPSNGSSRQADRRASATTRSTTAGGRGGSPGFGSCRVPGRPRLAHEPFLLGARRRAYTRPGA
jgi:hypothetical protein